MTAAVWILYAGQWLFTEVVETPRSLTASDERRWGPGELYKGPVLGLPRWKFWKQALHAASGNKNARDEAQRFAHKAVDFMDDLEKVYQVD
ncbi:hypothetical protein N7492_008066 [Penicillium capsulatum]|uniref:Uncharacterized protein n=1 Tax=Penicillium capsulatum TaxID=69766 RepID=A0A9W9LGJ9_9EURO|nr:hypothetical protein N7492_008066 [Penicillium capsulatum]KAJ6105476.1 hypothetical protein N7512_008993 [Penicillium capsulatum]